MFLVPSHRKRLYKSKSCPNVSYTNPVYGQRRQVHVSKNYQVFFYFGGFLLLIKYSLTTLYYQLRLSLPHTGLFNFGFSFAMPLLIFVSSKCSTNYTCVSTKSCLLRRGDVSGGSFKLVGGKAN